MMFAIDGPIDTTPAPAGTFLATHSPASRPPGTPPVPARKLEPVVAGWTWTQVVTARLITRTPATTARSAVVVTVTAFARHVTSRAGRLTTTIAASTATGTAMGSRYWKPLTLQTSKKRTGAAIQLSRRCSDQLSDRNISTRPMMTTTTASPSAGGTTWP